MSFVVKKKNEFSWPVKIKTPADGGFKTEDLNLMFIAMSANELKDTLAGIKDDRELCEKIVVGWKDVLDESNAPLLFNKQNFEMLLNGVSISSQIAAQYLEIYQEAAAKN